MRWDGTLQIIVSRQIYRENLVGSCWAILVGQDMKKRYGLSEVRSSKRRRPAEWLVELGAYLMALLPRGSPVIGCEIVEAISVYAHETSRFLFGVPSQDRAAGSAR